MESLTTPVNVFGAPEACLFAGLSWICIWAAMNMTENARTTAALAIIVLLFMSPQGSSDRREQEQRRAEACALVPGQVWVAGVW